MATEPDEPELPLGNAAWQGIAEMEEAADNDPEGFQDYLDTRDEINAEDYPDGDGES